MISDSLKSQLKELIKLKLYDDVDKYKDDLNERMSTVDETIWFAVIDEI